MLGWRTTCRPARPGREEALPASGDALLEARGVSAGYGEVRVLHDLAFALHRGEMVALLGANGAGKTTTLLALAGVLSTGQDQVWWCGAPAHGPLHQRAKEGLSIILDERSVVAELSVSENLRLGRGEPDAAVELFPELEPLLRRRAGLLSGGEQQILTLARALAADPKVLLIDELSLGLAPQIVERLLQKLRELSDDGLSVLVIEQQVRNALRYVDRALVMRRGRIVLEGTGRDLSGRIEEVQSHYLSASAPVAGDQPVNIGAGRGQL